jgi:hypothetical protein
MVYRQTPWPEIEQYILERFALPSGKHFNQIESVIWANRLLHSIQPPAFRAFLPKGLAVMFHEAGDWNDFPERIWLWQCQRGNRYAPSSQISGVTL